MEGSLEKGSRIPNVLFLLLGRCVSSHTTLISLGSWQVIHVGHVTYLGDRCRAHEALLPTTHSLIVLLVLGVLVLTLGLLFTVKHGKLLLEGVVLHAELATDRDKTAQTVDVVLVFLVDLLIHLKSFIE